MKKREIIFIAWILFIFISYLFQIIGKGISKWPKLQF